MKKLFFVSLLCLALLIPSLTFAQDGNKFILLASTIGPVDAGIVSVLEDRFEKDTGIRVRHVGAGTGEALKIAEKGNVDLVMVHAKALEEKFVKDGYGTERIPFMYNDFVIVRPASDRRHQGNEERDRSSKKIAEKGAPFVSREDKSAPMWRRWIFGQRPL
jgi:tungstate transport system substrate-binding protein